MRRFIFVVTGLVFLPFNSFSQDCRGGQIQTNEAFLYGRFETSMKSAQGNGVVSSFFLYNVDLGCNWPEENNEIDIEMTGNDTSQVIFTTHYPGPWYHSDYWEANFNPHAEFHDYAIEWEPGVVRWFVDGELVNVQDQGFVQDLIHPQRLMMNLWAAEAVDWVGEWDPSILPLQSEYEYVRVYEYTPGSGDYGTNDNFTLLFDDHFEEIQEEIWSTNEFGGFNGNYCTFRNSNVEISDGMLFLHITEEIESPELIPVTFSVDVTFADFSETDVVNLNGGFNNWCGQCNSMTELDDNVWTLTLLLSPGKHEYLFTKNFWEENGGAPLNSDCDYQPCDEYHNYGFVLDEGSDPLILETVCWGECSICSEVSASGCTYSEAC
ncbi:MAG: family 16 glycosylhydrolase, partial [Bacteroidota bacterium]